jgi:outer membrane protein OmpA-like peptidoglycan-associated protein
MRKFLITAGASLVGAFLLLSPLSAQAQELSLRVEPGVAIPLTSPQTERFKVGGAAAIKPELGLGSYFSVGPSVSFVGLPSKLSNVDAGTLWGVGGFLRVKRPHDEKNTDTGLSAISPWVDADLQYVRTGPLDRFGYALAAGASVPTSDERNLWVGPFVRYQDVYQADKVGFNSNSAKTLILGLSFELGAGVQKKTNCPPPIQPVVIEQVPPPPVEPPVVVYHDVDRNSQEVIQFPYDSSVLGEEQTVALALVAKNLLASKSYNSIRVEGHASSEGPVKYNNALSERRAQSVLDALVADGLPRDRLSVVGFGSSVPVASNKTEAGRVKNRRAEFVVKFVVSEKEGK